MAFRAHRKAFFSGLLLIVLAIVTPPAQVLAGDLDPNTVGKWQLTVPGGLWILDIHLDGTYAFHSEANDNAPSHSGRFFASNGVWALQSSTGISDGGGYTFQGHDTFVATGHLGTGNWQRAGGEVASASGNVVEIKWQPFINENAYLKLSDKERLAYVEGALDGYMSGYAAAESNWGKDYIENCGPALTPLALRDATDKSAKGWADISINGYSPADDAGGDWAMYNAVQDLCKH
jgi:hypothetical protein